MQRRIQRALAGVEAVLRHLPDASGDTPPVIRPEVQDPQDEEIERPLDQQVEIAIGAFDDPTVAAPVIQVNMNDKQPFFDGLTSLPVRTEYSAGWQEFMATLVSHQHPDHDTETWPPEGGFRK